MMWPGHFGGNFDSPAGGTRAVLWIVFAVIWLEMELSALGRLGGYDNRINKMVLDKHQDTIKWGFAITLVLYLLFEILACSTDTKGQATSSLATIPLER